MRKLFIISTLSLLFANTGCTPEPAVTPETANYKTQLTNLANEVILPTYADLHQKTQDLVTATAALQQATTAQNLATARQAWRDARLPWEQSEGFLFGPVEQLVRRERVEARVGRIE